MLVQRQAQRLHLTQEDGARVAAHRAHAIHVRLVVVARAQVPLDAPGEAHGAGQRRGHEAILVVSAKGGSLLVVGHVLIIPGAPRV